MTDGRLESIMFMSVEKDILETISDKKLIQDFVKYSNRRQL